jgi:hypothetical protein
MLQRVTQESKEDSEGGCTTFSGIARLFPKHIHAVTPKGFKMKVVLFACAARISCHWINN